MSASSLASARFAVGFPMTAFFACFRDESVISVIAIPSCRSSASTNVSLGMDEVDGNVDCHRAACPYLLSRTRACDGE